MNEFSVFYLIYLLFKNLYYANLQKMTFFMIKMTRQENLEVSEYFQCLFEEVCTHIS